MGCEANTRGTLRILLGAAPGVGKTFAMLNEGRRRRERGADVVVGLLETHQRAGTEAQLHDLEVVPRRRVHLRDTELTELDVDAVLRRRPQVCLVDELAHTNAPGSRHDKRWQDVEALLAAGIHVITTLNIQHLQSLGDVVARITGVAPQETIPDAVVRRADQIELVDMTPEALRRRLAHGNVFPPERVDAALANWFRPGNLSALRELALLWVADRVEMLAGYVADHAITDAWETRERVVVAITGVPGSDQLIRRAARMAGRTRGALIGVHVVAPDGLARRSERQLARRQRLLADLGGTYREVVASDVAAALVELARAERATQLVVGKSRRNWWADAVGRSVVSRLARQAGRLDLHVISTETLLEEAGMPAAAPDHRRDRGRGDATDDVGPRWQHRIARRLRRPGGHRDRLSPTRRAVAWAMTIAGLPLLTAVLVPARDRLALPTPLLLFLAMVVAIAGIGGQVVGLVAAVTALLLANWYFVQPIGSFHIEDPENLAALVVFAAVAVTVGTLVDGVARRSRETARARIEAAALARAAATLATDAEPLAKLLDQIRTTFHFDAVAVLARAVDGSWSVAAGAGEPLPSQPSDGDGIDIGAEPGQRVLVLVGNAASAEDRRVLRVFADQLEVALEGRRLASEAAQAQALADVDAVRTALLHSVSHDLRTPLASIKAYVSGLHAPDVSWSAEDTSDTLAAIETEADRLNRVVSNLLDASRLQSGALAVTRRATALEEPVAAALVGLGGGADAVAVDLPEDLPLVDVDPALLERAIANVVANALRYGETPPPVRLEAALVGGEVHVRLIDRGPGIPTDARGRVLAPFQRLGDRSTGDGVGLGLPIAKGFVEAMGGRLELDDTPGGGLTVTFALRPAVG